ncbi:HlyD family secretion protein [Tenacibaculum sp. SG-28]|uniref:HlyD family secretion protein n=1 Tax=Tenacibaculum sp. SG-28 TaxID=754426 RepID=UPI000CF4A083|nr:HlyD family efflux transporter periplasmic adaptor subunit [Tenacibaculum sp. SG-28]PQJ23437.1 hypothetical protein BSU00_04430 [Tenacibaculum sp. SG-28]
MKTIYYALLLVLFCCGCKSENSADAFGNFDAITVVVSAEGNGVLETFSIEEGQKIVKAIPVGIIDTVGLHLQKNRIIAQIGSLDNKLKRANPQVALFLAKRDNLVRERDRTKRMLQESAATPKQLETYNGQIAVINQQIASVREETSDINNSILAERKPLEAELAVLNDQIARSMVTNPINGTVLATYVEEKELVRTGMPLYKIANLETLQLTAYTSAEQLQKIQVSDSVTVRIDSGKKDYTSYQGYITWIASEAEFTPKNIETKEERVNLVYAMHIRVTNDGNLRIGMPAEVLFTSKEN